MNDRQLPITACLLPRRHRGFSFTELLFAVMIMGIGFIMIAAIFPVGLAQSKSNFDETQAANLARSAVALIERNAHASDFVADGKMYPLQDPTPPFSSITYVAQAAMISPADPRYAWVGFYRREPGSSWAQLNVLVVNRADPFTGMRSGSDNDDFDQRSGSSVDNYRILEPRKVRINATTDGVTFLSGVSDTEDNHVRAAAPGAFVVIGNDNFPPTMSQADFEARVRVEEQPIGSTSDNWSATTPTNADRTFFLNQLSNRLNGRVYRLGGQEIADRYAWFPGNGMTDEHFIYETGTVRRRITVTSLENATAYLVGRNRTGAQSFEGGAMDVAYYTSFISLRTTP